MVDDKLDAEAIAFLIACYMPSIIEQSRCDNVKVSIESTKSLCAVTLSTGARFAIAVTEAPRG